MKKILSTFLVIIVFLLTINATSVYAKEFTITPNEGGYTEKVIDGMTYIRIEGEIDLDGKKSKQVISYIGFNPKQNESLSFVTGDAHDKVLKTEYNSSLKMWRMGTVQEMVDIINDEYKEYEVLGGVNGDHFRVSSTGQAVGAYIRDYRVISKYRDLYETIGFKDNGEVVYGYVDYGDLHINIFNKNDELKRQIKVDKINALPDVGEISAFFPDNIETIPSDVKKNIFSSIEAKYDERDNYFFEGTFDETSTNQMDVAYNQFVVVGDEFDSNSLLDEDDYVIIQYKVNGDFADARYAISSHGSLVKKGAVTYQSDTSIAPRTSVGSKADGTTFFCVVDGRQSNNGMDGVTLEEMGYIMKYFGAVEAHRFDGGGSSTVILKDNESTNGYSVMNSPSDGYERAVGNGAFIVKGKAIPKADPIPFPDLREKLPSPSYYFVEDNTLYFERIPYANGYIININGVNHYSSVNQIQLPLGIPYFEIQITTRGSYNYGFSNPITFTYQMMDEDIESIFDFFKDYAKGLI